MRWLGALSTLCGALCLIASAHAQTGPAFGDQGTWLLGGGAGLAWDTRTAPGSGASMASSSGWLEPSADRFIVRDLALGASIRITRDHVNAESYERTDTRFGLNLRVTYRAALGGALSLLPRFLVGFAYVDRSVSPVTGSPFGAAGTGLNYRVLTLLPLRNIFRGGPHTELNLELFSPVVVTPVAGFYVGVGPYVQFAYAIGGHFFQPMADNWLLTFGISTLLGAWL